MEKDLSYFIDRVTALDSFWYANYYLRCMKRAPHGGVEYVYLPNFCLKHRLSGTWNLFCHYDGTIPAFLTDLINEELAIWKECEVDIEELLSLCFDGDFWYAGFRVLKPKNSKKLDATILWSVVSNLLILVIILNWTIFVKFYMRLVAIWYKKNDIHSMSRRFVEA